jgi:hypothetical protein
MRAPHAAVAALAVAGLLGLTAAPPARAWQPDSKIFHRVDRGGRDHGSHRRFDRTFPRHDLTHPKDGFFRSPPSAVPQWYLLEAPPPVVVLPESGRMWVPGRWHRMGREWVWAPGQWAFPGADLGFWRWHDSQWIWEPPGSRGIQ